MSVQLLEHKALLTILGKIEDEIAKLEDPFNKDLLAYKHYMELLQQTMTLLNTTIHTSDVIKFENEQYNEISDQLDLLKRLFNS
jgi:Mg2+ and Co2+ transporter CorA